MPAAVGGRADCSGVLGSAGGAEREPEREPSVVSPLARTSDACGRRSASTPTAARPPPAAPCTRRAAGASAEGSSASCGGPSAAGKLVRGKAGSDVARVHDGRARRAKLGMLAYSDSMLERVGLRSRRQRGTGKVDGALHE